MVKKILYFPLAGIKDEDFIVTKALAASFVDLLDQQLYIALLPLTHVAQPNVIYNCELVPENCSQSFTAWVNVLQVNWSHWLHVYINAV